MKKIFTLLFASGLYLSSIAQTHHVHIEIDTKAFPNVDCSANAGISGSPGVLPPEKLYLHSGLCTSSAAECFDNITVMNSAVWQHVVGNWQDSDNNGIVECPDDNIGLMNHVGNGVWNIDIILENYYTGSNVYLGNTSSGLSTVWNPASNPVPYTIGYVFRTGSSCEKGADLGPNNACMDYFIGNINTPTPGFINPGVIPPLTNYSPPGATFTTGVEEPNIIYHHSVSPNPVQDFTNINFFLTTFQPNFSMKIYNATGSLVKTVSEGSMAAGDKKITWDRTNESGERVASGVYYFVMQSRNSVVTDKLIVVE